MQEGRALVPGGGPLGEADDVIQVSGQIADVLLLFLQNPLVILCYTLKEQEEANICSIYGA